MTTLTITLENDLEQQVKRFAEESGRSLEEAATELLRRSTDLQKIRELRKRGREYAKQAGVEGEEEIYEAVRAWRQENPDKAAGAGA